MVRVYVHTLGCRLNQYESDAILSDLQRKGQFIFVAEESSADLAVVNTCTVTDQADKRNRQAILRIQRAAPQAQIIVTGCQAQTNPEDLMLPGVYVVPGQSKHKVPALIAGFIETGMLQRTVLPAAAGPNPDAFSFSGVVPQGHTRAYLKIQDGCDRHCSYCKIPQARGKGVSRAADDVLREVEFLRSLGIKEVILTGVNLGWYRDSGLRFPALLAKILENAAGMRVRLSSIEPCDVGHELAELISHPAFCKYLHVPLQSGSDAILRKMRRTYNARSFRQRLEHVIQKNPEVFIGTDVIVGFPGESESDFAATESLLKDLGVPRIHAFPYSIRQNTAAADFPDRLSHSVKKERIARLRNLDQENWNRYARSFVGQTRQGLAENSRENRRAIADNYLRLVSDQPLMAGSLYNFRLESVQGDRVLATCLGEANQVVCS